MAVFTIHQAKTNLSQLIAQAEAGEEVVIARGKKPVVKLQVVEPTRDRHVLGRLKGKITPPPDSFFFNPLPEDELRLWEGRGDEGETQ